MKRSVVLFTLLLVRKLIRIFDIFHCTDEKKSLFIRIDHLGDVICSLPAVEEYLNKNKNDTADLLVLPSNAALFKDLSLPFKILEYRDNSFKTLLKTIFLIRSGRYKKIFILHTTLSIRNILPTILSPKSVVCGFAFDSKCYNAFLDKKIFFSDSAAESTSHFEGSIVFNLVGNTNTRVEAPYPLVFDQIKPFYEEPFQIGFFTTVYDHEERRMWSVSKFASLADLLIEQYGAEILLFGGPSDYEYNEKILKNSKYPASIKNISGRFSLSKIPSIINSLHLIICVAAGLMHIAMSLKKEMIILLGPTPMERWVRKEYYADCIRVGLDCQPCERKIANRCFSGTFECMRKIEVDVVFQKAQEKVAGLIRERS